MGKFKITESEKNRILRLHTFEILKEQDVAQPIPTNYTLKDIQQMLVNKGYDLGNTGYISGYSPGKGVDGILGNKTLTAIEEFIKKSTTQTGTAATTQTGTAATTQTGTAATQQPESGTEPIQQPESGESTTSNPYGAGVEY